MFCQETLLFPSGGESNYRIPNVIVANDGTVLAFCNDRKNTLKDHAQDTTLVCARKKPGKFWEKPEELMAHPSICCLLGSAVQDYETGTSFAFVKRKIARDEFSGFSKEELAKLQEEDAIRAKESGVELGFFQLCSTDSGEHWHLEKMTVEPLVFTHINGERVSAPMNTHGSAHGIQLRHGPHRGRLLCPARIFAGSYKKWEEIRNHVYNNAAYSDDHGKTWKVSSPVQLGTGEGTLIELENGEILYNSRAYFGDGKRYLAKSVDGGATYADCGTDSFLQEETRMGCNASFLRVERADFGEKLGEKYLPKDADSVTIFVNPRAEARRNMTACVSFDEGKTWKVAKTFYEGACAYSSLDFSREDKHFYLAYEKGVEKPYTLGIAMAEFDLEWLLGDR